jgi:hypothetical protein
MVHALRNKQEQVSGPGGACAGLVGVAIPLSGFDVLINEEGYSHGGERP